MSNFVNTIDLLGDDVVARQLVDGSITEFKDDVITNVKYFPFALQPNLTVVDMPNLIGDLVNINSAFRACSKLSTVNFPLLTAVGQYTFEKCVSLKKVVLPMVEIIGYGGFEGCSFLHTVDLHVVNRVSYKSFDNCTSLKCLILRSRIIATADVASFVTNTPIESGTGYIYVPRALVDSYKVATNWSVYANQFRALEDYTVDGTITGELDESKI